MTSTVSSQTCPKCGKEASDLLPVDTGMKLALQVTGGGTGLPPAVCASCYESLTSNVSQGVKLRIEKETREKNKMLLWKGRVSLIKQARALMAQKAFSEAAVSYEKYLRTLEVVYNLKPGELTPTVFNSSKRSKELTVVASVYWDLLRIYDLSPRYGDRMAKAAQKLALFLPFSTIYPDIAKKAESFARSAKNTNVMRSFLKSIKAGGGKCFIATAVFDSPTAAEVLILRIFREQILKPHPLGRGFILTYYKISPPLAQWIRKSPRTKLVFAHFLRNLASILNKHLKRP